MTVTASGARFNDGADVVRAVGTPRPARLSAGGVA